MQKTTLIIPCYNEARRFDPVGFEALGRLPGVSLLFVDDGSSDRTQQRLREFCETFGEGAEYIRLDANRGKGEAVRQGILRAMTRGAEFLGYCDADLATPTEEVERMISLLEKENLAVVMGSRIQYLGTRIERRASRHYIGRVFSTVTGKILRVPVYDTQCGAKVFRRTRLLEEAFGEPFLSRWCFDVELLGRLLIGTPDLAPMPLAQIRELPLNRWYDVAGSKIGLRNFLQIYYELARVAFDLRKRRRRAGR